MTSKLTLHSENRYRKNNESRNEDEDKSYDENEN